MNILPYAYTFLVVSIVAFLFILLGRIFLNVETIFIYEYEKFQKNHINYLQTFKEIVKTRGENGWKLEKTIEVYHSNNYIEEILIFVKTSNKIKLF